ncbi:MAG: extracellular solute-binding protein [Chloroflexota bacterium]
MKPGLWMRVALLALVTFYLLAGCGPASPPPASTLSPGLTATPWLSTPGFAPTEGPAARSIRVWLPPELDPSNGTPAGDLLKTRLDEFSAAHPGLRLEVRVKAKSGPAGLLESLAAARQAAPSALPDLIALPYRDMESAATKGLIYPLDNLTGLLAGTDWYDYAHQLAQSQEATFGLPFAGDALVLVYRDTFRQQDRFADAANTGGTPVRDGNECFAPSASGELPPEWSLIQACQVELAFPAADPQALVTLALYQSAGGSLVDSQGRPALDPQILTQVLTFYQNGGFSPSVVQYANDDQAWQAFRAGRADAVITWASNYLRAAPTRQDAPGDYAALPLPGLHGSPYSLADGWVWAVVAADPVQQSSTVELAEYLLESQFLGAWTSVLGYLPPRPSALAAWKNENMKTLARNTGTSAQMIPPAQVASALAPLLRQAVLQVLNGQASPGEAAQAAVDKLK